MQITVTSRLRILNVMFGADDGPLDIRVVPEYVGPDGTVARGEITVVQKRQADAIALGAVNGRTDGEWGNREIETLILSDEMLDRPALPPRPALPAVLDVDGVTVLRERLPAFEGAPATMKPRFAPGTMIVWKE